jgi:amino acid adenylation domain-containing protein
MIRSDRFSQAVSVDAVLSEAWIADLLRVELAAALDIPVEEIDSGRPFVAMGMDSLMAMQLRNRVQDAFGSPIPVTLFFIHPTVDTLARGLLDLWRTGNPVAPRKQSSIPRISRTTALPLSYAQEQIWFLHELVPMSSAYNVAVRIRIRGRLDPAMLAASFDTIVERHEALRMSFRNEAGIPRAAIADFANVDLPIHDVDDESEVSRWGQRDAASPFDIGSGPLFRLRLLRFDDDHHVLLVTMHHIVTDGWSFGLLLRELGALYRAFHRGEPAPLPELPIQYSDYAAWQRQSLSGDKARSLVEFWRRDLAGAPALDLPSDGPAQSTPDFRGARLRFELGRPRAQALRAFCEDENITPFVALMAAFAAVLQRYSGQDDFVIGTLSANRARLEIQNLIGLFVNALPVRLRLEGDPGVRDFLALIRQRLLDVMAHEALPFEHIVNATERARDGTRNPLFQVQLVLQRATPVFELPGLTLEVSEIDTKTAKRDLTLTFFDDATFSGHMEYATARFGTVRAERLIQHFQTTLDAIVADPGVPIGSIPMFAGSRRQDARPRATSHSFQELFEAAADRAPDSIAVSAGAVSMTYRELDSAANRVARWLRGRGVRQNIPVAVAIARTADLPVAFLGVLKAGGIYVPVDPTYPKDRTDLVLAETKAAVTIEHLGHPAIASESAKRLEAVSDPDQIAYIVYTSGSTGKPKGVTICHGGMAEYAETLCLELGIRPDDRYLHTASISFSSSIRQLVVPLAAGATVVMADFDECRDPAALLRRAGASEVTVLDLVPTMVRQLADTVSASGAATPIRARLLLTASEPLRFGLVQDWRAIAAADFTWINMYGQTETTGIVSLYRVPDAPDRDRQHIVPIGRPRGNVTMLVLDSLFRPLPDGVVGELYIGGQALALGYMDERPGRFHDNPLGDGRRLYASGDLVRIGWDGTIEFIGRRDRQLKIRGLRVEPGEIEGVLLEHPGVNEAVVSVVDDGRDGQMVAAWFTHKGQAVPASSLRAHARRKLPAHMVPSAYVALERLPLTPNGKLDRDALPKPDRVRPAEAEHVPPRPGIEESLARIWRDVLNLDSVSALDNFFALGGHSLLAARVRSQIQRELQVDLPLAAIFEDQGLSALARRIEATSALATNAAPPPLRRAPRMQIVPASYTQEQIWQLEQTEPGSPANWNDIAVRIDGPLDVLGLVHGVRAAIERHEILRTVFRSSGGSLSQTIMDSYTPDIRTVDGSDYAAGWEPIDLSARPPVRVEIVRVREREHVLRLLVHRILCDGLSMRLLFREIVTLYLAPHDALPDPSVHYADYAAWERAWLTNDALAKRVDFFRRAFEGRPCAFTLPTDRRPPATKVRRGSRFRFELRPGIATLAETLAAREGASPHMVLLAAFAYALGKYTGHPAVVVGSVVSRRNHPGTERILGPFMNTLPLRIDVPEGSGLREIVRCVKTVLVEALANQDAPLHLIKAALAAQHGHAAMEIGQVAMVMADTAPEAFALGDISLTRMESEHPASHRALTLSVAASPGEIQATMTYDRDAFGTETIQRIARDFETILATAGTRDF